MKPPHSRKPRPVPAKGKITDGGEMHDLVYGDKQAWERLGHPEHGDKHNLNPASVDAWRRRQHERLRFLLVNDLLAGKALERGETMKRLHEQREWRQRQ